MGGRLKEEIGSVAGCCGRRFVDPEREADGSVERGTAPPVLGSVGMRLFCGVACGEKKQRVGEAAVIGFFLV